MTTTACKMRCGPFLNSRRGRIGRIRLRDAETRREEARKMLVWALTGCLA